MLLLIDLSTGLPVQLADREGIILHSRDYQIHEQTSSDLSPIEYDRENTTRYDYNMTTLFSKRYRKDQQCSCPCFSFLKPF